MHTTHTGYNAHTHTPCIHTEEGCTGTLLKLHRVPPKDKARRQFRCTQPIQSQAGFAGEYMTLDKHLFLMKQTQSTVSSLLTLECKQ